MLPSLKKQKTKEAVIKSSEMPSEEEHQVPLPILVPCEVDEKENVLSEDKPAVQPSHTE